MAAYTARRALAVPAIEKNSLKFPLMIFVRGLWIMVLLLPGLNAWAAKTVTYEDVVKRAQEAASSSYKAPKLIPKFLRELSYDQYQNIRFNPEKSLWQENDSRFQVMLVPPGLFYNHAVKIHVLEGGKINSLSFDRDLFDFTDEELARRIPADLGYAGLKLTYPLEGPGSQNQFLVFAGASYFRGVGADNAWGISARGVALDTGLPQGEEFPSFTEFWLKRPTPQANQAIIYALLNGPSITGAYQFTVHPGKQLLVNVKATLFARSDIELLGIAPLTSMFFYGENTSRPRGEWRARVHDSDGLLIHNGSSGEWLWRPLINPRHLEMDYFGTENVRGFGLLQRDTEFADFQDLGAHYHQRPSTWVDPEGDWGKGKIVLVQLPTEMETNDNIVAFWTPEMPLLKQQPLSLSYNLRFGDKHLANQPSGRAINTFVGDGSIVGGGTEKGAYRIIVDFEGGDLDKLSTDQRVSASVTALQEGEVLEHFVEYNPPLKAWRLSMLVKPQRNESLVLRAFLMAGGKALTETWTYRLPPVNDILLSNE